MSVELKDVAIRYIISNFRDIGFKDYVIQKIKKEYKVKEFWAVDGVSFRLEKGDFLGIVGKNGAGKSTLLKAVAGIIPPTKGSISVQGSIAALLELGSGFDGDMTVRENTFLRGALLGYTREFMNEMYGGIIEFAELEEFQDRPFKQLSSGMKSRLAFSIACLVRPEILILDEVLSVGDGAFREKSESKMREIIDSGATTLFVSHSLEQTKKLCNKVLWLEKGKQIAFGEAKDVCDIYEKFLKTGEFPRQPPDITHIKDIGTNFILKNIYSSALKSAEKRDYYIRTYSIINSQIDFFNELTSQIDLLGKNVLDISQNIPPVELVQETGAKKWVSIHKYGKGDISVFQFENKLLDKAFNECDCMIYNEVPRHIPEDFFNKFDVCVSYNRFNQVTYMQEVLDMIYKSLKKGGVLFSKFIPDENRLYEDYVIFMYETGFISKSVSNNIDDKKSLIIQAIK